MTKQPTTGNKGKRNCQTDDPVVAGDTRDAEADVNFCRLDVMQIVDPFLCGLFYARVAKMELFVGVGV